MKLRSETWGTSGGVRRRGLIAGVAALVTGALAKSMPRPAAAGHPGSDQNVIHLGQRNEANGGTAIKGKDASFSVTSFSSSTGQETFGEIGAGSAGGVYGVNHGPGPGVQGYASVGLNSSGTDGVSGKTLNPQAAGVRGQSVSGTVPTDPLHFPQAGIGVYGESLSRPDATLGYGVYGTSGILDEEGNIRRPGNAIGVLGESGTNIGVYGRSTSPSREAVGVRGAVSHGVGVHGFSTMRSGVRGESVHLGSAGVSGDSLDGIGVEAHSINGNGIEARGGGYGIFATGPQGAARFDGNLIVQNGDIIVGGLTAAVLPHPDGSLRKLFGVASTGSWLEDFGEGRLASGRAAIDLDPDFAALVRSDDYQVFLTPYGDCNGLYVSERGATGFTVGELHGGTSGIEFGYRLVANRQDVPASRLERVELPPPPPHREPPKLSQLGEPPDLRQMPDPAAPAPTEGTARPASSPAQQRW